MSEAYLTFTPFQALTVVRLPPDFSSAWSPGFDLHVKGEGETKAEAAKALVANLRELSDMLDRKAREIEAGKETTPA